MYIYNFSSLSASHTGKAVYEELLYSPLHPDDSSPPFTLNASLILLFETDYHHQCLRNEFDYIYTSLTFLLRIQHLYFPFLRPC